MRTANEQHGDAWKPMTLQTFKESGLLWKVNHDVLWPLGIALTIEVDQDELGFDWETAQLGVQILEPYERIVSAEGDAAAEKFQAFALERTRAV